jgi:hypothetical protein
MIDEIARQSKVNIPWKVIPFSRASQITTLHQPTIKGGSIVRLYHLEAGGFLSNGSLDYEARQGTLSLADLTISVREDVV